MKSLLCFVFIFALFDPSFSQIDVLQYGVEKSLTMYPEEMYFQVDVPDASSPTLFITLTKEVLLYTKLTQKGNAFGDTSYTYTYYTWGRNVTSTNYDYKMSSSSSKIASQLSGFKGASELFFIVEVAYERNATIVVKNSLPISTEVRYYNK